MSKKPGQGRLRQQPKKRPVTTKRRKRGVNFRADNWYASAANSIAISATGRGSG